MHTLAYSSEVYLIKELEVKFLPILSQEEAKNVLSNLPFSSQNEVIILQNVKEGDKIVSGQELLAAAETPDFVPVRFVYWSYTPLQAFFINLLKKIKRRYYVESPRAYTTLLQSLLDNKVLRSERTAENAYQWRNKRWAMPPEERQNRWQELYKSLKSNGYDAKKPILLVLNRQLGVKDTLLQGHHRIAICRELGLKEVAVSYWSVPRSFSFFKLFVRKKTS